jgi:hypothetical protein
MTGILSRDCVKARRLDRFRRPTAAWFEYRFIPFRTDMRFKKKDGVEYSVSGIHKYLIMKCWVKYLDIQQYRFLKNVIFAFHLNDPL